MFESLVELSQFGFVSFSCRNINRRADDPYAAITVKLASAFGSNPANNAVFFADRSIFNVIKGALLGIYRRGKRLTDALAVLWMQARKEVVGHGNRLVRRDSEHRLNPRWPIQNIGSHIHIPQTDFRGIRG